MKEARGLSRAPCDVTMLFYLRMISAQTLRVYREGKPVPTLR